MKGAILGAVGVAGVGVAVVGGGGGGPDDFVAVVGKPPATVYAAFSDLGPDGVTTVPTTYHQGMKLSQRIVKVPNEQVMYELAINDEPLVTAEVQFAAAENNGTRVAAELDLNQRLLNQLMREAGGPPMPAFFFQDFLIDQVFAQAMGEMVARIEEGRPLLSLAETHARWGSDDRGTFRETSSGTRASRPQSSTRPQLNARPALDPDEAVRQQAENNRPAAFGR